MEVMNFNRENSDMKLRGKGRDGEEKCRDGRLLS